MKTLQSEHPKGKTPCKVESRCLLVSGSGMIALGQTGISVPRADEVLVRAAWSCVSPGTETRVLAGDEPDLPQLPFIPGYAMTGTVVEAGELCALPVGSKVFCSGTQRADCPLCWGGHTEFAVVREADVCRIPEGLDLRLASAAKLAAIAYHGARMSQPERNQTVVVVGLGPIGLLSALFHALSGARVVATDFSAARRETAASLGIETMQPAGSLAATFAGQLEGGADIVVEATGVASVLAGCAGLLKPKPWDNRAHQGARLLIQASYAESPPLPYREVFLAEATILVPRDCQKADLEAVLQLMADGKVPIQDCIHDAGDPACADAVYRGLVEHQSQHITNAFNWNA